MNVTPTTKTSSVTLKTTSITIVDGTETVTTTDFTKTSTDIATATAYAFVLQSLDYQEGQFLGPMNGGFNLIPSKDGASRFLLRADGRLTLVDGTTVYASTIHGDSSFLTAMGTGIPNPPNYASYCYLVVSNVDYNSAMYNVHDLTLRAVSY
ncbi:hypothetical protein ABW20_dc0108796 [Dactylellina cionopaga]|nr:hypothetical protein ABW20_dc0108796 [Dactylellina cionopaga]